MSKTWTPKEHVNDHQACKDCEFYVVQVMCHEPICSNSNIATQQFDTVHGWNTKIVLCREYRDKHDVCIHYNKAPNKWYQFWRGK